MKVGIICIGDELLKGSTLNTNLSFLGQELLKNGIIPSIAMETPDSKEGIIDALEVVMARADIIITSGGLGPTADDVTKEFIAMRLGARLVQNGEAAAAIMNYWNTVRGGEMPPRVMNQSLVPDGAQVLRNRCGTAPGLIMTTKADDKYPNRTIIMLPGPPAELQPMFLSGALPYILEKRTEQSYSKLFLVCGLGESLIEERMLPLIRKHHPLSVAYCANPEYVKLFLTSVNAEVLGRAIREVRQVFEGKLLGDHSGSLPEEVLELLRERKQTLSTAESCTGGLAAKQITDIPGSSDVFKGGAVTYSNELKEQLLGVRAETLRKYGAVSAQCATEMVNGAAERFQTDAAIALTGIAGPDGGTPEKPVGLVYMAVRYGDRTVVEEMHLRRTRGQIRERAAAKAWNLLRRMILGLESAKESKD